MTTQATPFTGDPLSVTLSIDDAASPGDLVITLSVDPGYRADLRGFVAHIADESLLAGLSVVGPNVTGSAFSANSVIDLGHSLGLKVVAEGIENDWQARLLQLLNCDYLQGYFLGAPMSLEDLHKFRLNNDVREKLARATTQAPELPNASTA